jgi:hypothetical protein
MTVNTMTRAAKPASIEAAFATSAMICDDMGALRGLTYRDNNGDRRCNRDHDDVGFVVRRGGVVAAAAAQACGSSAGTSRILVRPLTP